jgi:hypothetical protein
MNNKAIPTLLIATIMIAGAFAFMPVQEASTVHTGATTTLAADAITAAKIADDAILAVNIGAAAIGASELADAVDPLINGASGLSADLNAAGLNATCGAGGDAFLVHYIVVGANGDVLEIDINDDNTANLELVLLTATLMQTGTVAGAAGATVEIAGNDDASAIKGIVTVQCTGNGTAAVA